ncbi:uncharacterized protein [Chiloscyllium punctatum]|uniref:uncharacterized protein isoform X2 n=1 Tax=Chiloscyllium punctatum TaxID=137246 RepID=UPI003B63F29F
MSNAETSAGPSELEGEMSGPCSKRRKTESVAEEGECDSTELPEKEKTNGAEKQNESEFCAPHPNSSSQHENIAIESSVLKFKEDNGHPNKNDIIVPENNAELENELSLFYKELEKIENETDLLVSECVDDLVSSEKCQGNTTVDKRDRNKTGKTCKKATNGKHKTQDVCDPCTGRPQIPTTEHLGNADWNKILSPARPQWNQPQAFIGPQEQPLPRFGIPLDCQRYSGPSQELMPFPNNKPPLSNSYSSVCNNTVPLQAGNECCSNWAFPNGNNRMQPGQNYFHDYCPRENVEHQSNVLGLGIYHLCQQHQKTEPQLKPGIEDKVLIFMRGPPGCGKSTLSRLLLAQSPNGVALSTDDYFCQNGVYCFDPNYLGEAHEWNQNRAKQSMDEGRSPIIIDNTNIQAWEMKPYAQMAVERCYSLSFREPETWWKFNVVELEKRNKHRVPREKIIQMMERFEYPISSEIVLNAVEPSRNNKVLLDLLPHCRQRQKKIKKKPKVHTPVNNCTRGETQKKKKHRRHRKVKSCQNKMSEMKTEIHWCTGYWEQHATKHEDDLSNEEHSESENLHATDLITVMRVSQDRIGAQVEKILNCKPFKYEQVVKGHFKMTNVLPEPSFDLYINLLESFEDSFDLENVLSLPNICWEANCTAMELKCCIYKSEKAHFGSIHHPFEFGSLLKKASLEYIQGQRPVEIPSLEDYVIDCKRKEFVNLILCRIFLTNLLKIKNNPLSHRLLCPESSSNKRVCQENNCALQLSLQDNSSKMKSFALSNILSEAADGMKEKRSLGTDKWINETDKQKISILQDYVYNPPLSRINSRRKQKRFYRLAPTFQISRNIPVDLEKNRRHELFLSVTKPMNSVSATNIFQSEIAKLKLGKLENTGMCHVKLDQTAVEGSQFCENISLCKTTYNSVKKEGKTKNSLIKQMQDESCNAQSWHSVRGETTQNDLLSDPSNETHVHPINSSVTRLNQSKTVFIVKPISMSLPNANISSSSEALCYNLDNMKKKHYLSQFKQYGALTCNPCVECEPSEKSRQTVDQEFVKFSEKCPFLELQLSLEFALQLVELFGSPGIDPVIFLALKLWKPATVVKSQQPMELPHIIQCIY